MKKLLCAICTMLLAVSTAQADIVPLDIPASGTLFASGSTFTTMGITHSSGAMFDITYTLDATANTVVVGSAAPAIRVVGSGGVLVLGVESNGETGGARGSLDGALGDALSFSGLTISNFDANGSGLAATDFSVEFGAFTIANGGAGDDGGNITVDGVVQNFGTLAATPTLVNFDSTGSTVSITPDTSAATNRFSISGISVEVLATAVPEPGSFSLMGFGAIALLASRRKRS